MKRDSAPPENPELQAKRRPAADPGPGAPAQAPMPIPPPARQPSQELDPRPLLHDQRRVKAVIQVHPEIPGRKLKPLEKQALSAASDATGPVFPPGQELFEKSPGGSSGQTIAFEHGAIGIGVNEEVTRRDAGLAGAAGGGYGGLVQAGVHELQHAKKMSESNEQGFPAFKQSEKQQDLDHKEMMADLDGDAPGSYLVASRKAFRDLPEPRKKNQKAFAVALSNELESYAKDLDEPVHQKALSRVNSFVDAAKDKRDQTSDHPWAEFD